MVDNLNYENILEINNLTKNYKGFSVDNVSFNLKKGYIMGLIGPNGAGKSTIVKLIMNLVKRDSGTIKIFGKDNIQYEIKIKERIGFVYDELYFYEEFNPQVVRNVIAPLYKNWDETLWNKYVKEFDIDLKKKIKKMSKGMKMKLSIALALSHNPELLIMDEPTSGLDPIFRRDILDILSQIIQDENRGIIFSTHITTDLDKIADYITFINKGHVIFSQTKDDIMENYFMVKGSNELLDKDTRKEFVGIRQNDYGFEALSKDGESIKKLFGDSVLVEKPTLEDIMVYSVKGVIA